jgi:hypothetical protein
MTMLHLLHLLLLHLLLLHLLRRQRRYHQPWVTSRTS